MNPTPASFHIALCLLLLMLAAPLQASTIEPAEEVKATPADTEASAPRTASEDKPGSFMARWKARLAQKEQEDPNRGRLLPIPIFITEPAIGEGLGLALTYFHRKKDVNERAALASLDSVAGAANEQTPPPTVTAAFGAYTSNDTAAVGVGHMNSFKDDHIRFSGMIAYANINSTFYVVDKPINFNLEGAMVFQDTRVRFGDSRWWWGIGFSYFDADSSLKVDLPDETTIEIFPNELTNAGFAGKLAWDSRDNTSMPNKGQFMDFSLWRYDQAIGGDYDYWYAKLKLLSFHPLHEKFVLGLRLDYQAVSGTAPFFAIPYVSLRGIPALRYQGDRVAVGEFEGRYNFTPRWSMVGFAGIGKVNSDLSFIDTTQDIYAYGLGARYKIFDAQNVWIGIDIARGPESTNWYIQVGQAW
jgi:hypothetical protein